MLSDAPAHELFVLLGPNAMARAAQQASKAAAAAEAAAEGGVMSKKARKKLEQEQAAALPDVLCVIQVAFEGRISKATLGEALSRGRSCAGDLIPWTLAQQFGDDAFAQLCGARVVRIATHPDVQRMGYGGRAMNLLLKHFRGELLDIDALADDDDDDEGAGDEESDDEEETVEADGEDGNSDDDGSDEDNESGAASSSSSSKEARREARRALRREKVQPRRKLPPLLVPASQRRPPLLHWTGVSFGATQDLLNFWLRLGFELCYLRQTANDITGEHTAILLSDLGDNNVVAVDDEVEAAAAEESAAKKKSAAGKGKKRKPEQQQQQQGGGGGMVVGSTYGDDGFVRPSPGWLAPFVGDARRRFVGLLAFTFRGFSSSMSLSLLGGGSATGGAVNGLVLRRPGGGSVSSDSSSSSSSGDGCISASELGMFVGAHDLKRLDLYARNMADHHLVTDLVPSLARLFFLGFLDTDPTGGVAKGGAEESGGGGGVSLSMVQKALLLGVGLQHKTVDDLAAELSLPASQVRLIDLQR
jgi:N-acetyltransferase 10